jgi:hypothetical protein
MEIQVNEYGAKAFKFYNVRYDYGEPFHWRMDDPKIAFPIYEKAQELGIDLIGGSTKESRSVPNRSRPRRRGTWTGRLRTSPT